MAVTLECTVFQGFRWSKAFKFKTTSNYKNMSHAASYLLQVFSDKNISVLTIYVLNFTNNEHTKKTCQIVAILLYIHKKGKCCYFYRQKVTNLNIFTGKCIEITVDVFYYVDCKYCLTCFYKHTQNFNNF